MSDSAAVSFPIGLTASLSLHVAGEGEDGPQAGGFPARPGKRLLGKRVLFLFHTGHGTETEIHALFPDAMICIKPTLPAALIAQMLRL